MELQEQIEAMQCDGKYTDILSILHITNKCLHGCSRVNPFIITPPERQHDCNRAGLCIAATLNNNLIVYMLYKAGIITKRQLSYYYGP